MRKIQFVIFVLLTYSTTAQNVLNRKKAEESVKNYMAIHTKKYIPVSFGEIFEQPDDSMLRSKLNTKEKIKYSLIHTYVINGETYENVYFHLNEKYNVVGLLTFKEMEEIMLKENAGQLDSIFKGLPER